MSVNQEFNNNRFRFKMPTNQVAAGNFKPIWNVGSIQSINIENDSPNDKDIIYYDDASKLWKTGPQAADDVEATDGTVTEPSISFSADLNTGFYRIGDDNLGITTGGVLRLDVSSTAVTSAEPIIVSDATDSSDKDTGSIVTEGGVGIELNLNVGGNIAAVGTIGGVTNTEFTQLQNIDSVTISNAQWGYLGGSDQAIATTDSVQFAQVTVDQIVANDGTVTFSGTTGNNIISIPDNLADAFSIKEGANSYITFVTTDSSEQVNILQNLDVTGNITSTGGTIGGLTSTELTQLQNIDSVTVSNTQWGYLGASNQGIATTDAVTFAQVTVDQIVANDGTITFSGSSGSNVISVPDNLADAFTIKEGTTSYITVVTTDAAEHITLNSAVQYVYNTAAGTDAGLTIPDGTTCYKITVGTETGAFALTGPTAVAGQTLMVRNDSGQATTGLVTTASGGATFFYDGSAWNLVASS